jgi:hypothetical protein
MEKVDKMKEVKSMLISKDIHKALKIYTSENGLLIKPFVEETLLKAIEKK